MVAFRMSPEEADMLDKLTKMSGLTKQEYIVSKIHNKEVVVQGNPRVYKQLRDHMCEILEELQKNQGKSPSKDLLDTVQFIGTVMDGFQKTEKEGKEGKKGGIH